LNGKGEGFRKALLTFGLALTVFGLAGLASAVNANAEDDPLLGINCNGKVKPFDGSIFPDSFSFEFGCNQDISAITIISNRLIDNFATEIVGVDSTGEVGANQDFFCTSTVPSFGFGCYGAPGKTPATVITAGNRAVGEFSLSSPVCDSNTQPMVWGIAQTEYSSTNDLVDPPKVTKWLATSEPFLLNTSAIKCKVLNPKVKAKQVCAKVKKAKSPRARAAAKRACDRARAAVRKAS
jgi:hypothetical protein